MMRKAREERELQPSPFALERLPRLRKEDLPLFEDVGAFAFRFFDLMFFDLMFPREASEIIPTKVGRGINISTCRLDRDGLR